MCCCCCCCCAVIRVKRRLWTGLTTMMLRIISVVWMVRIILYIYTDGLDWCTADRRLTQVCVCRWNVSRVRVCGSTVQPRAIHRIQGPFSLESLEQYLWGELLQVRHTQHSTVIQTHTLLCCGADVCLLCLQTEVSVSSSQSFSSQSWWWWRWVD